jgi:uncharacterized protein
MMASAPFWKSKTLEEMSPAEWESLCDGCGRCCTFRVRSQDSDIKHPTDVACRLLDLHTGHCGDYPNRLRLVPSCTILTPEVVRQADWLPDTCGYRRVAKGQDLAWWHPLISGDPDTVRLSGMSVRGRVISETKVGKLEYHAVNWPAVPTGADGTWPIRWRARFGGANADLLTPLRPDLSIDIDRMAEHALGLLELGCDGMRIFGPVGEGDTFNIDERIAALDGLARLGVPISKLLPDLSGGDAAEIIRLARHAADLGCRGMILPVGRGLTLNKAVVQLKDIIPLYLDATNAAASARLSAPRLLDDPVWDVVRHSQGILATGQDAGALVASVAGDGIEILGDDSSDLPILLRLGGAGCISAIANIDCRLPAYVCRDWERSGATAVQVIAARIGLSLARMPLVSGLKALLARQTGEPGWLRVRSPRVALAVAEQALLCKAYDRARAKSEP